MTTRCAICRRPLTNPVSLKHGLGPDCLKRAALAGTAPMEALGELATWKRQRPKRTKAAKAAKRTDTKTPDLFDALRDAAIDDLSKAVTACRSLGVQVDYTIHIQ